MTDCSMRRVLWDFGRTAVQPVGSHGVALLSHRRGLFLRVVCIRVRFFPVCIHRAPVDADLRVCVGDNEKGYVSHLARRTCYSSVRRNQREKIDVTMCYSLKNNFHLLGPISTSRCRKLGDTPCLTEENEQSGREKGEIIIITASFDGVQHQWNLSTVLCSLH